MSDRLNAMFNHVDAFLALRGGLGTMEEIFHISSWAQLHIHHKPIGLLNVNGFFYNLLSFLDQAVEQEFLTSQDVLTFCSDKKIRIVTKSRCGHPLNN